MGICTFEAASSRYSLSMNMAVSSAPFSSFSCGSPGQVSCFLCILFVFFFVMSLALNPNVSVNFWPWTLMWVWIGSTRMSLIDVEGYDLAKDLLIAWHRIAQMCGAYCNKPATPYSTGTRKAADPHLLLCTAVALRDKDSVCGPVTRVRERRQNGVGDGRREGKCVLSERASDALDSEWACVLWYSDRA
jgi:hypothetical protein